jgi:hypothetical protein
MSFLSIWERIKSETDLTKLIQLVDIVETTQPYISRKKKENKFPIEWAFKIGQRYSLSTDWILTGKGPKRLYEQQQPLSNKLLTDIDTWLSELSIDDPNRQIWFKTHFEDNFPMFKEWKLRREEEEREGNISANKKIA